MKNQKFRIFFVDKDRKEHTVFRFYAKDRHAALKTLKKYRKEHDDHEYFYSTASGYVSRDDDGKETSFDTMEEMMSSHRKDDKLDRKLINEHAKGYQKGMKEGSDNVKNDVMDIIKTGHLRSEWYNLYSHMLDDLEYNLPILISKKHGYPSLFIVEARTQLTGKPRKEVEAGYADNPNPSDEEEKIGMKMWDDLLNKLLLDVRLYKYYENYGIVDMKNKAEVALSKEYEIPILEGTYRDIDYDAIKKLQTRRWNAIWDFMKKYGQALWD